MQKKNPRFEACSVLNVNNKSTPNCMIIFYKTHRVLMIYVLISMNHQRSLRLEMHGGPR